MFEPGTSNRPRKLKSSIKMSLPDLRETVRSIFIVESPPSPLYLLGNLQSGKSKKKLYIPGGFPGWNRTAVHGPLLT
jgi:hypothetical protein